MPAVKQRLSNFILLRKRTAAGEKPVGGSQRGMMSPGSGSLPFQKPEGQVE